MSTRLQREHMAYLEVMDDLGALHMEKNARYGRNLPRHGLRGVVIRIGDKTMRLENLVLGGVAGTDDESVADTLMDLAGYCIKTLSLMRMGDMSDEGEWRVWSGMEDVIPGQMTVDECIAEATHACCDGRGCDRCNPHPELATVHRTAVPADTRDFLAQTYDPVKVDTVRMGGRERFDYPRPFAEAVKEANA